MSEFVESLCKLFSIGVPSVQACEKIEFIVLKQFPTVGGGKRIIDPYGRGDGYIRCLKIIDGHPPYLNYCGAHDTIRRVFVVFVCLCIEDKQNGTLTFEKEQSLIENASAFFFKCVKKTPGLPLTGNSSFPLRMHFMYVLARDMVFSDMSERREGFQERMAGLRGYHILEDVSFEHTALLRLVLHLQKEQCMKNVKDETQKDDMLEDRLRKLEEDMKRLTTCSTKEGDEERVTVESLKAKLENAEKRIREKLLCQICFERDRNAVIMPCMHMVCCSECASSVGSCPICRGPKAGVVSAFLE
eukprot:TRINITY_DN99_c2_g1_i1.p1 TRINITY_DN99_c2_g1~~TRINITY_DN99_c2_g1_i1.p1  ORF type:complete len:301 (+),score=54.32 TRINITY_DN99_c2_g1_i1:68-970(+)